MKSNSSQYIKVAAFAAVLLAAAGCSSDSVDGVQLKCESGLVVCGHMCCDGTCNDGVCTPAGGGGEDDALCPKGLNECRGACVDYKTAHNNCGSCGKVCEDNEACVEGQCKANACPSGMEVCGGACVNKTIDAENCGSCGNVCGGNAYCAEGGCQCPNGYSDCDNDMSNGCEAATLNCDSVCSNPAQFKCESGTCCDNASECCGSACCGAGSTCCGDGVCADLQNSEENCGTCGNACTNGRQCVGGSCELVCADATPDKCEALNLCTNFLTDVHHCGNCDTQCATNETCEAGDCTPSEVSCEADPEDPEAVDKTQCWGTCVDLDSDPENCGTCGNVCVSGQTCESGSCECPPDMTVCGGACVDFSSDKNNCGSCGNACLADQSCEGGACECPDGLEECGDKCLDFSSDKNNCGSCGNACLADQSCNAGHCECPDGLEACGDKCLDYSNDKNNCGSCGHACEGEEVCQAGECKLVCKNESDIICGDTCFDPNTSNAHCGNCETSCASTETCVDGTCTPSTIDCNAGLEPEDPAYDTKTLCWGTCTDLSTDVKNCGACGNACLEGQNCTATGCACPDGTTLCGNACMTFESDAANCGSCGHACGDGQVCEGGECVQPHVIKCFGKDTDIMSDVNNCGSCLHKCSTGESCESGVCTLVCGAEYTLCNGACINLKASAANCGACGKACADGQSCYASASAEGGAYCGCSEGRYDCDGLAANGCESTKKCECTPGETQKCWRGAAENRGKGICRDGSQICDASGQFWGQCTGGVMPSAITCDDQGLFIGNDQNCNGTPDDQEECVTKCDLTLSDSSYIGCEYWTAYTENADTDGNYAVIISNMGSEDANITVYKGGSLFTTVTVKKGTVETIVLSQANNNNAMLMGTVIQKDGFRIVSTKPVTAYQFNPLRDGAVWNDALLLLPKNVYGNKYYNIIGSGTSSYPTYIAIQATSTGSTTFKIKPTLSTRSGTNKVTNETIPSYTANVVKEVTLNQYEVLQLSAYGNTMTGTEVTADKPFVAIGGCASCYNARKMTNDVYDHYSEQLFPYQSWGTDYAIAGFQKQGAERDQWRVLAVEDTELTITPEINNLEDSSGTNYKRIGGSKKITLSKGQIFDIVTPDNFYMKSNKPILVAGFLGDEISYYMNRNAKDPSYTLVVPVQQFRSDYSFMIPADYASNYLTIIAPNDLTYVKIYKTVSGSDSIVKEISGSAFTSINSTGYKFYRHDMGDSTNKTVAYKLIADKPVGVQSYGYTSQSSYAYPLGLNLTKLNTN